MLILEWFDTKDKFQSVEIKSNKIDSKIVRAAVFELFTMDNVHEVQIYRESDGELLIVINPFHK